MGLDKGEKTMIPKQLARFLLPLTALIMLLTLLLPSSRAQATEVAHAVAEDFAGARSLYSAPLNGPIESVSISGPITGDVNTAYTFTSLVSPESATTPIAHIWRAPAHSPGTHIGYLTAAVTYPWNTPGLK
jgi:hypothetical protein